MYCGAGLNPDGSCSKGCSASKAASGKQPAGNAPGAGKKNKKGLIIGIIAGALALSGIITAIVLVSHGKKETVKVPEEYLVDTVDAENHLAQIGEIKSVQSAKKSKSVHTEKDAAANLTSRGFTQMEITAEYTMNGDYYTEAEVSKDGKTKHPAYNTYYITSQNQAWYITEINGRVFAAPSFYNASNSDGVYVIVSETDSMISYDSETNSFYELVPFNTSGIRIITVDRIDSDALEALYFETE